MKSFHKCIFISLFFFTFFSLIVSESADSLLSLINPHPPHTSHHSKPSCYTPSSNITSKSMKGKWVEGTYKNPGVFAKERDLKEWWFNACPAQMAIFSCYHHDKNGELTGHGYEAHHNKYELETCQLNGFSATSFLHMMKNRKLVICCDSVSMQIFSMLVCSLHGTTEVDYSGLRWIDLGQFGRDDCVDGSGIHCHLGSSQVYYPEFNLHIYYFGTHLHQINGKHYANSDLSDYITEGKLTSSEDILLLNQGVHMHTPEMMEKYALRMAQQYHELDIQKRPILIWRETLAQHFNTSLSPNLPMGYFETRDRLPCAPLTNLQIAYQQDFRNHIANQIFEQYNIPILRVYNASAQAYNQHIGPQIRTDEKGMQDCTHYCENSGLYYFVRDLFHNMLHNMLVRHHKSHSTNNNKHSNYNN